MEPSFSRLRQVYSTRKVKIQDGPQKSGNIESYKIILSLTFLILVIIIFLTNVGMKFNISDIDESSRPYKIVCSLDKSKYVGDERAILGIHYNQGSDEITFGYEYEVMKNVDGEWIKVSPFPPDSAWPAVLCVLAEGENYSQEIPESFG
jgi:hypothetical protein